MNDILTLEENRDEMDLINQTLQHELDLERANLEYEKGLGRSTSTQLDDEARHEQLRAYFGKISERLKVDVQVGFVVEKK